MNAEDSKADGPDGYETVFFSAADGLPLHARDYGRQNRAGGNRFTPVVCLAGLTRNCRDFHQLALHLSRESETPRRVVCFDYRGRGRSGRTRDKASYTLAQESNDVLAGMAALGLPDAAFIGTSRGVLVIMTLAAMRPGVIRSAIFNDAGPVIEGAGLAHIKAYLERMPKPDDWDHAARILKETHGQSFPILDEPDWHDLARAIFAEDSCGELAGDYDPALVEQMKDLDFSTPLPALWPQFEALRRLPLMTIRGENSDLLSEKTVDEMIARHPDMAVVEAPGQGHPPVLHVGGLDAKIDAFLKTHDGV